MSQQCQQCQQNFEGRLNQKFCSQRCKNIHHNQRNREKETVVKQTNKILHKNWNILQQMYYTYKSKPIEMDLLKANGFKPRFHTHTHNSPVGEKYSMIYDFGYKSHMNNQVQIVKGDILI